MYLARLFGGDTTNHVRSISQSLSHVKSCLSDDEFFVRWTPTETRRAHRLSSKPLTKYFGVFVNA